MKLLIILLLPFAVATSFAATQKSMTSIGSESSKSIVDKIGFNMELTTELAQDRKSREVIGTNNFFEANVSYRMDRKNSFNLANGWTGIIREDEDTKTSYDYVQLEYNRKNILSHERNGIDLRLHARASYTTNAELREKYGTYGIGEVRALFGRPLIGKLKLNKYITYLRLQKYFIKDNSENARDFGWRAKISPSYEFVRGLEASLIMTYSGYKVNDGTIDEDVEINPSVRYQLGKMAFIAGAEFKPYDTKKGSFHFIEGFEKTPTWSFITSFYVF